MDDASDPPRCRNASAVAELERPPPLPCPSPHGRTTKLSASVDAAKAWPPPPEMSHLRRCSGTAPMSLPLGNSLAHSRLTNQVQLRFREARSGFCAANWLAAFSVFSSYFLRNDRARTARSRRYKRAIPRLTDQARARRYQPVVLTARPGLLLLRKGNYVQVCDTTQGCHVHEIIERKLG